MVAPTVSLKKRQKPLFVNSYKTNCHIFSKNVCNRGFQGENFVV